MSIILDESDRHWSGPAACVFALGLSAFTYWIAEREGKMNLFIWFLISVWMLMMIVLIIQFIWPKRRILRIDAKVIDWEIQLPDASVIRDRVKISSIEKVQFHIPRLNGTSHSLMAARMIFVLKNQEERELPFDFSPGVYREKILQSILGIRPDVLVEDILA